MITNVYIWFWLQIESHLELDVVEEEVEMIVLLEDQWEELAVVWMMVEAVGGVHLAADLLETEVYESTFFSKCFMLLLI